MTAINAHRSTPLKALKAEIKAVFEEYGDEIEIAHDALDLLPEQLQSDYGVEVSNPTASYIYRAIKARLHRNPRSAIEREIARLKGLAGLDDLRTWNSDNVETHLVLSVVALVADAFTAHRHDKPRLKYSLSRII